MLTASHPPRRSGASSSSNLIWIAHLFAFWPVEMVEISVILMQIGHTHSVTLLLPNKWIPPRQKQQQQQRTDIANLQMEIEWSYPSPQPGTGTNWNMYMRFEYVYMLIVCSAVSWKVVTASTIPAIRATNPGYGYPPVSRYLRITG